MSLSVQLTTALSAVWVQIQLYHKDVPDVLLLPVPNMHPHRNVLGHFAALRWRPNTAQDAATSIHEVVVIAEHMNRSAEEIVTTLLHEAAHAMNFVRKLKDCSKSQYHNMHFMAAAEELGMHVEQMAHYGFAKTTMQAETVVRYAKGIEALSQVLVHRYTPPPVRRPASVGALGPAALGTLSVDAVDVQAQEADQGSRYKKASCQCDPPFLIRVARRTLAATTIRCDVCKAAFARTPEQEQDEE